MTPREIVQNYVTELRRQLDIDVYPYDVNPICDVCDIHNFLFTGKNNYEYEQIKLDKLGIYNSLHRASIIGLYNEQTNKNEYYIIDPTYGQFFKNTRFKQYMFNHHYEFTKELLDNGFIECTKENFHYYLDGFLNTFKQNDNNVYEKADNLLKFTKTKKRKKR